MNACGQEFLNKSCVCLSDPLDPWANICAYIDKQNGLVYPCNPGCCVPRCENLGPSQNLNMELHRTGGVSLPPGFGNQLFAANAAASSAGGTDGSGGSGAGTAKEPLTGHQPKIVGTQSNDWLGAADPKDVKVWQVLGRLVFFLVIIFLAAAALD